MIEQFKVLQIKAGSGQVIDDFLAQEVPLTIIIGDKELVTLLCMPFELDDLVRGFLFSSGLIKKARDLARCVIDNERWIAYVELANDAFGQDLVFKRLFTSGCGRGVLFYNTADILNRAKNTSGLRIEAARISALMAEFQKKSLTYIKTGGVHSAALADGNDILIFREDIGRHNAIDKVIGGGLECGGFGNRILVSSGRVSSEVLFKAQKTGIPILISQSAPTGQAVRLARDMDITLVGFARGNRMNIYSKEERVIYDA